METMGTRAGATTEFPVDDETYDLLQTLTSKLEALDAYRRYEQDASPATKELFREIAAADRRIAEQLLEALRRRLTR